jgi:hypothetical protein
MAISFFAGGWLLLLAGSLEEPISGIFRCGLIVALAVFAATNVWADEGRTVIPPKR